MNAEINPNDILAAFGKATMRLLKLQDTVTELECEIDKLRLDAHHQAIRLQALTDEKMQLIATIKEKIETVRIDRDQTEPTNETPSNETTTSLEPVGVIEPFKNSEPMIVRVLKRKDGPLLL